MIKLHLLNQNKFVFHSNQKIANNMDFPFDIAIKKEDNDCNRDSNDNIQQPNFNVEIKMEKQMDMNEEVDWCVTSFESCGDLLEPLFFKQVTVPQGPQCEICYKYFSDGSAILKHNLTHLRVTIFNPTLFQCDHCESYFTEKQLVASHIMIHNEISRTSTLNYKRKAFRPSIEMDSYQIMDSNSDKEDNLISKRITKDGFTNFLNYKPKSSSSQSCDKLNVMSDKHRKQSGITKRMHRCNICNKVYTYQRWHSHMIEVHGDGGFSCNKCDLQFKCKRYLLKHNMKKHSDDMNCAKGAQKMDVQCDQCDTMLQSLYALTTHKRNVHSGEKHVCDICKSELKCKSYLLAHMRRVHYRDGKKHECECGKSYRSRRYLMVHKRNAHLKK